MTLILRLIDRAERHPPARFLVLIETPDQSWHPTYMHDADADAAAMFALADRDMDVMGVEAEVGASFGFQRIVSTFSVSIFTCTVAFSPHFPQRIQLSSIADAVTGKSPPANL
jgi:hypothetical protein